MHLDGDNGATAVLPHVPRHAKAVEPATLAYQPGLDGLRGLALLAIVVYHSGLSWMPAAFLSVSTFFTLSGFLITAVMLAEHGRHGRISLKRFWSRRFRRLLPASLVAIVGIVGASAVLGDGTQLARMRGDAVASLFYGANWRFIALGDSYGDQFTSPSPFTHFWTLGIEEQFYLVFPLIFVAALALGKGNRKVLAGVLGALAALSVGWSALLLHHGSALDRVYFGTDTRAELLTGGLLAVWWMRRRDPVPARASRPLSVLGAVALGAVLVLWATATLDQRAYYRGGLAVYSLLTLVVLAATLQGGALARALSWRPLVSVGVVSYGAYLFHWPILVWLDLHTGLPPLARLALGLPATLALAALSHHFVEKPIRSGDRAGGRWARTAAPLAVTLTLVIVLVVAAERPGKAPYDFDATLAGSRADAGKAFDGMSSDDKKRAVHFIELQQLHADIAKTGAPTLASYGDSTALLTGVGLGTRAYDTFRATRRADYVPTLGWAQLGCGLVTTGHRRIGGKLGSPPPQCDTWVDDWRRTATANPVDIAYVEVGTWDVLDQQPDGFSEPTHIGDRALDALLRSRLEAGIAALHGHAELIVLALSPDIEVGRIDGHAPDHPYPESDPVRMARFRALLRSVADAHADVTTVDLAGWIARQPDDDRLRPDGIHLTEQTAITAATWLGPELVRIYRAEGPR